MNYLNKTLFLIFISFIFISCSNENEDLRTNNNGEVLKKNINEKAFKNQTESSKDNVLRLVTSRKPNSLTELSHKMGLTSVKLVRENIEISSEPIMFNGEDFDFSDLDIKVYDQKDHFRFKSSSKALIDIDKENRSVTIQVDGKRSKLKEMKDVKLSVIRKITPLLVVAQEVTNEGYDRTTTSTKHGLYLGVTAGLGRSTSTARMQKEVDDFLKENPNCSQLGGIDTSCA